MKKIITVILLITIIAGFPLPVLAEDDIASGVYDGVDWRITSGYDLIIGKDGEVQTMTYAEGRNGDAYPWYSYRDLIRSVSVKGTVKANGSLYCMFSGMALAKTIDVSALETSGVTNMSGMFDHCETALSIEVSGFDTHNVTAMDSMFNYCCSLTELDLSNYDTSNVMYMSYMFMECNNLTALNISGFNTSKVKSMSFMFNGCNKLPYVDVSGFITNNVTNFSCMFQSCYALNGINVSGFDTSSAINMGGMFSQCFNLTEIDLSHFDTSQVNNMNTMFQGCAFIELDVSGFDTSNVQSMNHMFFGCPNLRNLDLSGFNTSRVTDMREMFSNCASLETLNIEGFDTRNVANMSLMFCGCKSLKSIDLSGFDTSSVYNMNNMLAFCTSLKDVDISFDMRDVTIADDMLEMVRPERLVVPRNVSVSVQLWQTMYDTDHKEYNSLPANLSESITLYMDENGNYDPQPDDPVDPQPEKPVAPQIVKSKQSITVYSASFSKTTNSSRFNIRAKAVTGLTYTSSNKKVAIVDSRGNVAVTGPGTAVITIRAAENANYKAASRKVTVRVSLAAPGLTVKAMKGKKAKLTWTKVNAADGYKIYIKGPKDKAFKLKLTKSAKVKSVTHKGLKKKKKYQYKVVAYKKVNGRIVYSKFSPVRTIKAK